MTVGQVAAEYPVQVSITNERGINNLPVDYEYVKLH